MYGKSIQNLTEIYSRLIVAVLIFWDARIQRLFITREWLVPVVCYFSRWYVHYFMRFFLIKEKPLFQW